MTKKSTKKQPERQQQPLPQATQAGVTELTDADLEQVQGGQKKKGDRFLTLDAIKGEVTNEGHSNWIE